MNFPLAGPLLYAATLAALVGCAVSTNAQPAGADPRASADFLTPRLKPEWLTKASRIQADGFHVFYQGKADGGCSTNGTEWFGTIRGDILMINSVGATVVPNGSVEFSPKGFKIKGWSSTSIRRSERWKPLLRS